MEGIAGTLVVFRASITIAYHFFFVEMVLSRFTFVINPISNKQRYNLMPVYFKSTYKSSVNVFAFYSDQYTRTINSLQTFRKQLYQLILNIIALARKI